MANFQGGISGGTRQAQIQETPASPGGGGGGGYGGGGGSYNITYSKEPEDIDDINAQLANTGAVLERENANIGAAGKKALENIQKQREANAQQYLMKNAQLARNSEWQPNQQKEQSVLANMRRVMGNAAYGSGLSDLVESMKRYDDMADVELIKNWKENQDNAYNNWYQANADLISDYNEQAMKTQSAFDEAYNNYLQNISNINAKLGKQAYDKNGSGGTISQKIDDGTLSVALKKNNAASAQGVENLLKAIINQASSDNPNIPNTGGNIDYIRPNNAVAQVPHTLNGIRNAANESYARQNFANPYLMRK